MIKDNKDAPVKIMYYDLETVTLESPVNCCAFYQFSGIIEIDGVEVDRFDFLVNPNEEFEYNEDCLIFNEITRDDLASYMSHEDAHAEFIKLLDKHVDKFDKNDKLHKVGFNNGPFDDPKLWEWFAGMDAKTKIARQEAYEKQMMIYQSTNDPKDKPKNPAKVYCTIGSYFWANSIDTYPIISLLFIKYRNLFPNFKLRTIAEKLAQMGLIDQRYLVDGNWHNAVFDIEATRAILHFTIKMFKLNIFGDTDEATTSIT